jgi:RAP1 GTPase activating protein 1
VNTFTADTTGTTSVYTTHVGYEIMFHVSTLLPYNAKDKQQLERKRHLGNDVVVIVFKDSDEPFAPNTVKSEFNRNLFSENNTLRRIYGGDSRSF